MWFICHLPDAGAYLPRCCRQQTERLYTRREDRGCHFTFVRSQGWTENNFKLLNHAHLCVRCLSAGAANSPAAITMLSDVILEEEFDKNGDAWYDPQDLEHGKSCSALRSHPKLCLTLWAVITAWTVVYRQQDNMTDLLPHLVWYKCNKRYKLLFCLIGGHMRFL